MKALVLSVGLIGGIGAMAPQGPRTFAGTITDSMCDNGDHSGMRMGPTDAECTKACVEEHDASLVLAAGKDVYRLSDQKAPLKFAGQKVTIKGTLDAKTKTIHVDSIAAAKSSRPRSPSR